MTSSTLTSTNVSPDAFYDESLAKTVWALLEEQRVFVTLDWTKSALYFLQNNGPYSQNPQSLAQHALTVFLSYDLALCRRPEYRVIDPQIHTTDNVKVFTDRAVVLQVDAIRNISSSQNNQNKKLLALTQRAQGNNSNPIEIVKETEGDAADDDVDVGRSNKLLLTDGHTHVVALDLYGLCLSLSNYGKSKVAVGAKLALSNVIVRRGALMLDARSVRLLGGALAVPLPSISTQLPLTTPGPTVTSSAVTEVRTMEPSYVNSRPPSNVPLTTVSTNVSRTVDVPPHNVLIQETMSKRHTTPSSSAITPLFCPSNVNNSGYSVRNSVGTSSDVEFVRETLRSHEKCVSLGRSEEPLCERVEWDAAPSHTELAHTHASPANTSFTSNTSRDTTVANIARYSPLVVVPEAHTTPSHNVPHDTDVLAAHTTLSHIAGALRLREGERCVVRALTTRLFRFKIIRNAQQDPEYDVIVELDDGRYRCAACVGSGVVERCVGLSALHAKTQMSQNNDKNEVLRSLMLRLQRLQGFFVLRKIHAKTEKHSKDAVVLMIEQRLDSQQTCRFIDIVLGQ